ncbi:MAG TPA: ABC transporter transmembrane domain-containing protein, partial [Hyphomonadaceae bacterium]|nr:ABC transporter transmembrane domain-containing protein [Hyphomonadaceae bacterium]
MSDGSPGNAAPAPAGEGARFDRMAGTQRRGEGSPERAKSRSLRPLLGLMPYVMRQKTTAILAIVFLALAAALNLAITYPAQWLGDHGFGGPGGLDQQAVNTGFLAIMVIALLLAVFSAVRFYFFSRFGERLAADLRGDVYARLMTLSPAYFSQLKTGEAVSRLTADITLIESFFGSAFSMAVRSTVTSLGALVLMGFASWKLTLILIIGTPILILPIMGIGRRVRKLSVNAQDRIADAASEATETLDAIDLVQAYGMEKEREGRFRKAIEASFTAALERIKVRAMLTAIIIALMFCGVAGVVWLGANSVISGEMSVGSFIQFVLLAMFGVGGFATVAEVFGDAMRASGAAQRSIEILEQKPDIAAPASPKPMPAKVTGHVKLEGLSFSYPAAQGPSLSDVTFEAKPGELVALVGPSGAGKSTVFRMLLRFFDPQSGRVTLDGVDARETDPLEWRARFAYVPQEAPVFSGDALGNVRFGRLDATEEEAREALKKAEAFAFLEPRGGLAAEVGAKGRALSGGERQRIAIARALVRGAPVMLLDEATSALDAANERLVQKALDQASQGRTTLVIAHRLATVRRANRIIVMEHGRVVEQGDHESLVRAGGLYAKLAEMQ